MKPRLLLLFAAGLALAFALGRFSARAPDERLEVAEVQEVQETKEVEETTSEERTEERQEERIRIVYRDRWRTPEGVERETELELDADTARSVLEEARIETRVEVREVEVVRELEVERIVRTPLPDWRVSGMVGLEIDRVAPVYGLQVERRILGPIHLGVWGLSAGAVGLGVSVAF